MWTRSLNDKYPMTIFWTSAGCFIIDWNGTARFTESIFGSTAIVVRLGRGNIAFGCVCGRLRWSLLCVPPGRSMRCWIIAAQRFTKISWLAASWYQVAERK